MKNNIPTAEELLRTISFNDDKSKLFEQTLDVMIKFAKLHVKAALEEQASKARLSFAFDHGSFEENYEKPKWKPYEIRNNK